MFNRVTNPENKLKRHHPFSAFVNQLAHPPAVMISPADLIKYGKQIGMNPVGTGPFEFVEWKQPDDVKAVKNYTNTGSPTCPGSTP